MKSKNINTKGSKEHLERYVKENFKGNNKVHFLISERGNQRIEIEDILTKEIWQSLEDVTPSEDITNFDDIANALLYALMMQMEEYLNEKESQKQKKQLPKPIGVSVNLYPR